MDNRRYLECNCKSLEHTVQFMWFNEDSGDRDYNFLYMHTYLNPWGFWRRLVQAVKHIFGYQCRFGCVEEFLLTDPEVEQLRDICNEYLEREEDEQQRARTLEIIDRLTNKQNSDSNQET